MCLLTIDYFSNVWLTLGIQKVGIQSNQAGTKFQLSYVEEELTQPVGSEQTLTAANSPVTISGLKRGVTYTIKVTSVPEDYIFPADISFTLDEYGTINGAEAVDGIISIVLEKGQDGINKDSDGDGKPDVNIDTDGDGKPDVNVDTDGDGKPDVNIDTDGDGKPDVNIDTDGDGDPDKNIDANGDGIIDSFNIIIKNTLFGTVTSSHRTAVPGTVVTIGTKANSGYTLMLIEVCDEAGNKLPLTNIGGGRYIFTMPISDVTVDASFRVVLPFEIPATGDTADAGVWLTILLISMSTAGAALTIGTRFAGKSRQK